MSDSENSAVETLCKDVEKNVTISDNEDSSVIDPFPENDLTLIVEGKQLHVNSEILKQASPVFRSMLESDFKEKTEREIPLPGKSHEAMVEFLKCTYPFIEARITVDNVFQIIPIADEYQTDLKLKCEDFLINVLIKPDEFFSDKSNKPRQVLVPTVYPQECEVQKDLDRFNEKDFGKNGFEVWNTVPAETVLRYFLTAEKYNLKRLLKHLIEFTSMRKITLLEELPAFQDISLDTRYKIAMVRLRIIEGSYNPEAICTRNYD